MSSNVKRVGCLSQVDKILEQSAPSSVFTLHHWSPEEDCKTSSSGEARDGYQRGIYNRSKPKFDHRRNKFQSNRNYIHARQILLKVQESSLNFLIRWCLLDDSQQLYEASLERRQRESSNKRQLNLPELIEKHQTNLVKQSQTRLLMQDVKRLRNRNLSTLIKYIFWRWLTWVNVCELLLISLLAGLCIYQCCELLEDYYNYPTHVIVTNVLNDDFRTDLPGITLCDNNRLSRAKMRKNYPELNKTHFLAMTFGYFESINNFSLRSNGSELDRMNAFLEEWYAKEEALGINQNFKNFTANQSSNLSTNLDPSELNETDINWVKVSRFLAKTSPSGHYNIIPDQSIIDSLVCATISGDQIPCDTLKEIISIQGAAICRTLFHDSVLWDPSDPSVKELEYHMNKKPISLSFGKSYDDETEDLFEYDPETELREQMEEEREEMVNEGRLRIEMDNMEIIRIRINFNSKDYVNPRLIVGARLAVHSSSTIGEITHKAYHIEPGNWYTYYVERSDYHHLPPPYSTQCFDYDSNRYIWQALFRSLSEDKEKNSELIKRQVNITDRLIPEYGDFLRKRAMGRRECIKICLSELSSIKCGCWNPGVPYIGSYDSSFTRIGSDSSMPWCRLPRLEALRRQANSSNENNGDDLFYQTCSKEYTRMCVSACPTECYHSNFEVIQQSRSWPSHESQRYSEDRNIWTRLRKEAECCATISIIYTSPASTSLMTEPKYTRQDMVTIISGNIEAWLGISAVHAYLFFERFYDASLEAQITRPSATGSSYLDGSNGVANFGQSDGPIEQSARWWHFYCLNNVLKRFGAASMMVSRQFVALAGGIIISILTKVKLKFVQLFTYLSTQQRTDSTISNLAI